MLKAMKRSFFVKTLCAVLALSVAAVSAPKKSEAALILVPIAVATGGTGVIVGASIVGAGALGSASAWIGVSRRCNGWGCMGVLFPAGLFAVFLVLDETVDASSQTEAALAERYSFIEDRTVISQLAQTISEKAAVATANENGSTYVSVSREELTEILAPTDVMENHAAQFEAMVQELQ